MSRQASTLQPNTEQGERQQGTLSRWRHYAQRPVDLVREVVQLKRLDPWQQETLNALAHQPLIAVAGGTGIGKETVAACAVIWFLLTRPYSKVAALSASAAQVQVALWQELHKLISSSRYLPQLLEWSPSTIKVRGYGERWQAFQSVAAKRISVATGEAQAEGGAGIHEKHLLIIVSEASGVDDAQWDAKLATLTGGPDNRCLAIGNPVRRSGRFFEIFTKPALKQLWWTRHVSHAESSFVNKAATERLIAMAGEDSPLVQAKVYGQFPTQADGRTVFGYDEIEQAFERNIQDNPDADIQIGIDVARYGTDDTCIYVRRGRFGIGCFAYSKTSIMDTIGYGVHEATRWWNRPYDSPRAGAWALSPEEFAECQRHTLFVVDDGGVGGGVVDALRSQGWRVYGLNNSHSARNGRFYKSRGDEIWFVDGKLALAESYIPRDELLQHQLCTREARFDTATGTKRRLETKEEMARRGLASPDRADALMLAFAVIQSAETTDFRRAFTVV